MQFAGRVRDLLESATCSAVRHASHFVSALPPMPADMLSGPGYSRNDTLSAIESRTLCSTGPPSSE